MVLLIIMTFSGTFGIGMVDYEAKTRLSETLCECKTILGVDSKYVYSAIALFGGFGLTKLLGGMK